VLDDQSQQRSPTFPAISNSPSPFAAKYPTGLLRGYALVENAGLLELDDHQRQAVDETDQIRAAGVERAGDAKLADQQKNIVRRLLPIHYAQPLRPLLAALAVRDGWSASPSSGTTSAGEGRPDFKTDGEAA